MPVPVVVSEPGFYPNNQGNGNGNVTTTTIVKGEKYCGSCTCCIAIVLVFFFLPAAPFVCCCPCDERMEMIVTETEKKQADVAYARAN